MKNKWVGVGVAVAVMVAVALGVDVAVIVGVATFQYGIRAFRWTSAGGLVDLGTPIGTAFSGGTAVSLDGSVIVGFCGMPNSSIRHPIRWTQRVGMRYLDSAPSLADSVASAVTSDGEIVAGWRGSALAVQSTTWSYCLFCVADYDGAGGVTVQDVFAFLADWFSQNVRADLFRDGMFTANDIFTFLASWFAGC